VYEGGIRVPCYVRWPAGAKGAREVDTPLAHIDVTPTLIEACKVERDGKQSGFDGRSFAHLLSGDGRNWPARTLFFQWHRGDAPERYRAFAARNGDYKLVQANGVAPDAKWKPRYELFDIKADPFEEKDLAAERPEVVAELKKEYEAWFADVTKRGFDPPRIVIGSEKENPVRLSRQDWRGPKAGWNADSIGHWEVKVERAGKYEVTVRSGRDFRYHSLLIELGGNDVTDSGFSEASKAYTTAVQLPVGSAKVHALVGETSGQRGSDYVELKYLGPAKK
jgi:hypothetical protein